MRESERVGGNGKGIQRERGREERGRGTCTKAGPSSKLQTHPTVPAEPPSSVAPPPKNELEGDISDCRRRDHARAGAASDPSSPGGTALPPCLCAAPPPPASRIGSLQPTRPAVAKPTAALAEQDIPAVLAFRSPAAAASRKPSPLPAPPPEGPPSAPEGHAFRSGGGSTGRAPGAPKREAGALRHSRATPAGGCAGGGDAAGGASPGSSGALK